jgi:flagellar basal-body rod protein FlgF
MESSLSVSLSAQLALQRRLDTIAHNVANASTAGFRAEEVKFETLLSQLSADPVAYASAGGTYLSRRGGELIKTDNLLDVAVEGDAWLAISTAAGQVYTRDGRMRMTETGELQSINNHPILDAGGAPIQLDPTAGLPRIARDGMITQNGRQVGAIGLFVIDANAKLERHENSGVIPDRPATPALDFTKVGVAQGYMERANVNPVMEITQLIAVQRTFEAINASVGEAESSLRDAIKTLGSNS